MTDRQADILIGQMARWIISPEASRDMKAQGLSTIACIVVDTCEDWNRMDPLNGADSDNLSRAYQRWAQAFKRTYQAY